MLRIRVMSWGVDWSYHHQSEELIPKNLSVGQEWAVGGPTMCDITLQEHLNQFTAGDGQSYSDVLKFSANYLDSTVIIPNDYYYGEVYKGKATLFFAKGIGLVEADISDYEHIKFWRDFSGNNLYIPYHEMSSGSVTKD